MIISKAELDKIALNLINAMILEGPDNEQELHTLQILLDPEVDDDLEDAVLEATEYTQEAYGKLSDMIDEMNMSNFERTESDSNHICNMINALYDFRNAYYNLNSAWDTCDINLTNAIELYPFEDDFNAIEIGEWCEATMAELKDKLK